MNLRGHSLIALLGTCLVSVAGYAQNTFPSSGNVGIGTTSPTQLLTVNGAAAIGDSVYADSQPSGVPLLNKYLASTGDGVTDYVLLSYTNTNTGGFNASGFDGQIYLYRGTQGSWNGATVYDVAVKDAYNGYVGMRFNEYGSLANASLVTLTYSGTSYTALQIPSASSMDVYVTGRYWAFTPIVVTASQVSGVSSWLNPSIASGGAGGNVGIGTASPAYPLDVAGKIHSSSGVVYPDGTSQTTAWTGVLCGGDYAEAMNATGGKKKYEPGDVLVLASGDNSDVEKSAEPYSTMVAGIFATKPGVIGRRDALGKSTDDIPMAMVGVVPTKVSTENGPIHKGDLLVTSSTPGFAMKGTDRSRMLGAVIGKAMGSLDSGTGAIEVLVTLQ